MVLQQCGLTNLLVLVNAQSSVHIVFQIYDFLRFDSILVMLYL